MGLTNLGIIHTLISLVAVGAAIIAFIRDKRISSNNTLGVTYFWTTVLTCLTGFGIYQHGGFGAPHVLGVITLVVIALAWGAGTRRWFGKKAPYVETIGYSATFFFHMVPAITETTTRLPLSNPLIKSREAPELQAAVGVCFILFLIGAFFQFRRIQKLGRWQS